MNDTELTKTVEQLAAVTHDTVTNILFTVRNLHEAIRLLGERIANLEEQNAIIRGVFDIERRLS